MLTGTRIGAYDVLAKLGEGGMGEVYRAADTVLKRQVALKVLPPEVADDPERVARFQREAEVLASLNHPNIAHLYGLERSGGTLALVMELVEGPTLADRIAAHTSGLPIAEALSIARQIADALQAAHEKGIVHRDLKPANVKITKGGTLKVLDFGLAKDTGESAETRHAITLDGMLVGTPRYMAPEQLLGDSIDARTDVYAAGLVLFEMLTGRSPFDQGSIRARLEAMLTSEAPNLPSPHGRTPVNNIIRRALDRRPDARYQTAAAMAADLRAEAVTMTELVVVQRPEVRLVVLPFRFLRPDHDISFLEGALPEAITTSLSLVPSVVVRSNIAALRFGASADLGTVARESNVPIVRSKRVTLLADDRSGPVSCATDETPASRPAYDGTGGRRRTRRWRSRGCHARHLLHRCRRWSVHAHRHT
jgi:serine/threonine protein kinase